MNYFLALIRYSIPIFLFWVISGFAPKKQTWVAIGDSITYLNDHQNETGYRITKGYMTIVTEKLPHIRYINQGHNGWTSGGIAKNIDKLGLTSADIYTVFLGTNDWWQGRPIGKVADYQNNTGDGTICGSFRIIIDKLKSLNPTAKIILITPMQRGDFVYINAFKNNAYGSYKPRNNQSLEQVADAIKAIGGQEGIEVIDLFHTRRLKQEKLIRFKRLKDPQTGHYKNYAYPAYIDIPFDPVTDEYPYPVEAINMTYDGLHPSDKGYRVIARMLVKKINS